MTENESGCAAWSHVCFPNNERPSSRGSQNNHSPIYLTDGPNNAEKRRLVKDRRFGVDWIYEVAKRIAEKMA